jgi:hypothetical protein
MQGRMNFEQKAVESQISSNIFVCPAYHFTNASPSIEKFVPKTLVKSRHGT